MLLLSSPFKKFASREHGSLTLFSLFIFMAMLIVCGMAVDLMLHERHRVAVQNTSDAAVLAAAQLDVTGEGDPEALVREYFELAGLEEFLEDVRPTGDENERTMTLITKQDMPTMFMNLVGVDELPLATVSQATQSAIDVEISLVLDISSSMNRSSRLPLLKEAVHTFATDVMPSDPMAMASDVSINVVPYSLTVNPGDAIAAYFNIEGKHSYSNCMWFDTADYETLSIEPDMGDEFLTARSYERYTHMADGSSRVRDGEITLPMCPDHTITPLITEPGDLTDAVDALGGWDGTGIDIGAKWGLALLDPAFRPVVDQLILDNEVDARMSGRPYNYGTSKKFLIIMSDGENDSQRDLHERMRSGPSPFWRDNETGNISVLVRDGRDDTSTSGVTGGGDTITGAEHVSATGDDETGASGALTGYAPLTTEIENESRWYHEDEDEIEAHPDTDGAGGETDWSIVSAQMTQMSWPEVYNIVTTTTIYDRFFEKADDAGYLTADEADEYKQPLDFNRVTEENTNQRLKDICQKAALEGVSVFAISFDPPSDLAKQTLADCASASGNFFPVNQREISEAFSSIAREITKVRLTQ